MAHTYTDVNAGIDPLSSRRFIYLEYVLGEANLLKWLRSSFQDSFTDGSKSDGLPLDPAIIYPPNPEAGGRSTNGLTWVENLANDIGANIMDYAVSSSIESVNVCACLHCYSNPPPVLTCRCGRVIQRRSTLSDKMSQPLSNIILSLIYISAYILESVE